MNSPAASALTPRSALPELLDRERTLANCGIALMVLAIPLAAMIWVDPRLLDSGYSQWVKPVKFFLSAGLFALTSAWFFGYVRPERRASRSMRWTVRALLLSAGFELFWITWQAGNGVDSHFNTGTPLNAVMFGLMGLFALILTGTTLPLAWEIARRPVPGLSRDYVTAVVIGLVMTCVLGTATGIAMSVNGAHAVGLDGQGLPLFGWNRLGGDIRISHFLGMHAEQLIPLGAALMGGLAVAARWRLLIGGSLLYAVITVAVLMQALAGAPLLPA
ncbi:MAG TPA: hypothetical protein VEZ41_00285 [Allosphingosinicella sp.]|nr:hypothetical protein [Allosphingosinicella sp.]